MKIYSILSISLTLGIVPFINAQQLEELAKEVNKIVGDNKDDVANATATFAKGLSKSIDQTKITEQARPIIDDIKSMDIEMVEQQAKQTASQLLPKVAEKIPATRAKAREVRNQLATPTPAAISRSKPLSTKPKINPAPEESAPNLGDYRPDASTRTAEPLPSSIGSVSQLLSGPTPGPQSLSPKYRPATKFDPSTGYVAKDKAAADTAVINSNEMEADRIKNTITFRGNVILEMDDMELKCDNLIIQLNSSDDPQSITATGGTVQVKQEVIENGRRVLRIARARKAVHEVNTEITTLSGGPPMLQNGDQLIQTDSEDSVITMNGKTQRYHVGGSSRMASPVDGQTQPQSSGGRTLIRVPIGNGKSTRKLGLDIKGR